MANTLQLEIITPEKIAYQDDSIDSVNVPSENGYLGILPHHTSLFAQLTEGELKISKGNEEILLAIGGGFIEVNKNKVTIIVTRAVHATEINEKKVIEAKQRAEQLLKDKPTGEALLEAASLYRRSLLDLKIIRKRLRNRSLPNIQH